MQSPHSHPNRLPVTQKSPSTKPMYSLYVVTDEKLSRGLTHAEIARRAVAGGANVIQLRDKEKSSRELYEIACEIREICRDRALFFVNDRLDIALAAKARDEGRVNVDDLSRVLPDHLRRDGHQEAGQHHQIRLVLLHLLQEGAVEGRPVLIVLGGHAHRRDAVLLGPLQGVSATVVADHSLHGGPCDLSAVYGVQNGLEIGSASGHHHHHSQHTVTPFSPASRLPMT